MKRPALIIMALLVVLAGLAIAGYLPRHTQSQSLIMEKHNQANAIPSVMLVPAMAVSDTMGLALPARIEADQATEIYARAQGYIRQLKVDIGSRVRKGQLLASISQPEIEQDIISAQTQASLARANLRRLEEVTVAGAISQGELDASRAAYRSAQAQLQRLVELKSFQQITAPYNGVITNRSAQEGAFVSPGSTPLFSLSKDDMLRIYVDVPQSEQSYIDLNSKTAILNVPELQNHPIEATLETNSGAYDQASRTLTVFLRVPTSQGLLPGMYATVRFKPAGTLQGTTLIPANAMYVSPDGPAAIRYKKGVLKTVKLRIVKDLGASLIISNPIAPGDSLVVNPNVRLTDGLKVNVLASRGDAPKPPAGH